MATQFFCDTFYHTFKSRITQGSTDNDTTALNHQFIKNTNLGMVIKFLRKQYHHKTIPAHNYLTPKQQMKIFILPQIPLNLHLYSLNRSRTQTLNCSQILPAQTLLLMIYVMPQKRFFSSAGEDNSFEMKYDHTTIYFLMLHFRNLIVPVGWI